MRTVADVIDAVSTERRSPSGDVYRHLAPVYDVFARTIDYDAYASFIRTHEPEDTTAIGLFACGTGRLLATVADRYEIAVGFDRSSAMLSQATARTDAPTVVADLRTCVVPGRFDVVTILGNSLVHLAPQDNGPDPFQIVLSNAFESLRPGGVLLCDFIPPSSVIDGHVMEAVATDDPYQITRTIVTRVTNPDAGGLGPAGRYTYAYKIEDRRTNRTARVSATAPIRGYRPASVLRTALDVGFTEAALVESSPESDEALAARKPT
ncbi:class I SAM-dependent methyltransferase [Natrialba swarupiae]|uniref:Class I SAM-dependent methyltransferase n=1 Tax=Natrialba swarupiae TaxID=2448032 RepID=A0A5D5AMT3_9EURY|nr:class I SAM-dependent methyltransferase [Natrialba swarupiae]TYT61032.1 class I SAM-dependent methyltransferase [Natrialba swarupiae]